VSRKSEIGNRKSIAKPLPVHERLDLFVLAKQFAIDLYKETKTFPADERFGLTSQIRRAAVSIPANVAEGAARRSKKEFVRFLLTARGSATELRLLLDIACQTGSLSDDRFRRCEAMLDRILAMTTGLIHRADRGSKESGPSQ
jgi:four helix bundle protein